MYHPAMPKNGQNTAHVTTPAIGPCILLKNLRGTVVDTKIAMTNVRATRTRVKAMDITIDVAWAFMLDALVLVDNQRNV